MRFSPVFFKQHLGWMFKNKWKVKSKQIIDNYAVPEDLKELNVKIYDALEVARPKKEIPKIQPPDPYKRNLYLSDGPENPNWHDQPIYMFDRNSRLIEGFTQGKSLIKTVEYEGFPPILDNITNNLPDIELEDSLQHCILESALWDGVQEKLPKRFNPEKPAWKYDREYGISHNRKIFNLLTRLLYLCERIAARKYSVTSRMQLLGPKTKLKLIINEKPVLFESINEVLTSPDILLCSNKPLPLLFNKDKIQETVNEEIPSLHPVNPLISLEKLNIFTEEKIYPLNKDKHLHTLFISHNTLEDWSSSQKFARALGLSFAFVASHAQLLYGENVKELPVPQVIQSIWLDANSLGCLFFQLNTLDLNEKDGIKNQVLIDGPYKLYDECNIKTGLVGYNSEFFQKMLAMYLNGI